MFQSTQFHTLLYVTVLALDYILLLCRLELIIALHYALMLQKISGLRNESEMKNYKSKSGATESTSRVAEPIKHTPFRTEV